MPVEALVVCEYCDAVHRRQPLAAGAGALCRRCGSPLYRRRRLGLDATLALSLAALIALVIANLFPVLSLNVQGVGNAGTLWGAVLAVDHDGYLAVAVLLAVVAFFAPLLQLLLLLHVAGFLRRGRRPPAFVHAMHALRTLRPWSMIEVFVLAVLVAAVKLATLASLQPGIGLWGFAVLTVLLTILAADDDGVFWDLAERAA